MFYRAFVILVFLLFLSQPGMAQEQSQLKLSGRAFPTFNFIPPFGIFTWRSFRFWRHFRTNLKPGQYRVYTLDRPARFGGHRIYVVVAN